MRIISLLAVLVLIAAACGGGDDAGTSAPSSSSTTTTAATQDGATTTTAAPGSTTEAPTESTTEAPTGTEAGALAVLTQAIDDSTEATSARMEGSIEIIGGDEMVGEFRMDFSGAFADNANYSFIMDLGGIAAAAGEEIPPEYADLFGEMEIRQIGETSYIKFGLFSMFGVPTEWVSFPADEGADAVGGFTGSNPTNPAEFLKQLEDAKAEVTEVGRETVRGVETTRYRAVFDIDALKEGLSAEELAELDEGLPADAFPSGMPMEFWIGDDGQIYRYVIDLDGSDVNFDAEEGQFERMIMTYEIYDHGADIDIEAPPADQVTDGSSLGGSFGF
jgi:hypothetical protein